MMCLHGFLYNHGLWLCVCARVCMRVCVRVCVRVLVSQTQWKHLMFDCHCWLRVRKHFILKLLFRYKKRTCSLCFDLECVCVCVCVCVFPPFSLSDRGEALFNFGFSQGWRCIYSFIQRGKHTFLFLKPHIRPHTHTHTHTYTHTHTLIPLCVRGVLRLVRSDQHLLDDMNVDVLACFPP